MIEAVAAHVNETPPVLGRDDRAAMLTLRDQRSWRVADGSRPRTAGASENGELPHPLAPSPLRLGSGQACEERGNTAGKRQALPGSLVCEALS